MVFDAVYMARSLVLDQDLTVWTRLFAGMVVPVELRRLQAWYLDRFVCAVLDASSPFRV